MYRLLLHFLVLMSTSILIFSPQGNISSNSNDRQFLNSGGRWVEWHPNQDVLAIVYDEDFSIVSNYDQEVWLYTSSGQAITQLPIHPEQNVKRMEWSPDGNKLAIETYGSRLSGDFIFIFDTTTINSPSLIAAFPESHPTAEDIAWSPDSSLLATNFYGYIKVWNVSSGELVSTIESDELGIDRIAWNSDSSRLAGGTSGKVLIWDISAPDESLLATLPSAPSSYYDIEWGQGGQQLAIGNYSNVDVWEWNSTTSTYQQVATLSGHNDVVTHLDWKTDRLASLSLDFTVRVWDTNSWQQINVFPTSNDLGTQNALSLSPDGSQVAYAHSDGQLRIELICDIDVEDSDEAGLVSAINTANGSGQPTTICLAEDSTYTLTTAAASSNPGKGGLEYTGLPFITGNITIEGQGATITRSGTNEFRLLKVNAGASLTLKDVTLSNGVINTSGGAIWNSGTLTIADSTLTNNTAATYGGGIYNAGTLTLMNTTLSYNHGGGGGGGLRNDSGTATIEASSFTGNDSTGGGGGAISNASGSSMTITDSVLTTNRAGSFSGSPSPHNQGGAINNAGTLTMTSSSLTNNVARTALGGSILAGGTTTVHETCFSGNNATSVHNPTLTIRNFTNNWWGAANGPSGAGPGSGDSVSTSINFSGFITTGCPN